MKNKKKLKQSSKQPRKVSNIIPKEMIDEVLATDLGVLHPRDVVLLGSIFIKISPENPDDKLKFETGLSKFSVQDDHVDEPRLSFQKVIPVKRKSEELTPDGMWSLINECWGECSEARDGKFWGDSYCFYIDLLGGPNMVAKISELLSLNLQVEIWDPESVSRVEYVQKYDGKVKKVKSFGFRFTDTFVSNVYDGIPDRMN